MSPQELAARWLSGPATVARMRLLAARRLKKSPSEGTSALMKTRADFDAFLAVLSEGQRATAQTLYDQIADPADVVRYLP